MQDTKLSNWFPAILVVTAIFVGMLYVTGVFAAGGDQPQAPQNFQEVQPANRCSVGEGAGPRAAGTIFRGARPDEQGMEYLKGVGIKSIMDLETSDNIDNEEKLEAQLGLSFDELAHPMSDGMGVNELPDGTPDNESIIEAVAELRKPENFPIYVHCQYGDDRTGMTVALHRVFDECWAPKDAESEWKGIAGFWHNLYNFPKFDYFNKVMSDPNLHQEYVDELNKLAPAPQQ